MEWEGEIHELFMKTEVDDHLTSCEMLIDFCERKNLFVNKKWFNKHLNKLESHPSPLLETLTLPMNNRRLKRRWTSDLQV